MIPVADQGPVPDQIQVAAHPLPHGQVLLECSQCGLIGMYPMGTASHAALAHLTQHGVPIP